MAIFYTPFTMLNTIFLQKNKPPYEELSLRMRNFNLKKMSNFFSWIRDWGGAFILMYNTYRYSDAKFLSECHMADLAPLIPSWLFMSTNNLQGQKYSHR